MSASVGRTALAAALFATDPDVAQIFPVEVTIKLPLGIA